MDWGGNGVQRKTKTCSSLQWESYFQKTVTDCQRSVVVQVKLTCWCPDTRGIACRYKKLLRRKNTLTWNDPEIQKTGIYHLQAVRVGHVCKYQWDQYQTIDGCEWKILERRCTYWVALDNPLRPDTPTVHRLTLLMNSGATSGVLLNSPHTCKSLTQQMPSLSSAKVWEPVISRVTWGLTQVNWRGSGEEEISVPWRLGWRHNWRVLGTVGEGKAYFLNISRVVDVDC